jgi:hypothetical protein
MQFASRDRANDVIDRLFLPLMKQLQMRAPSAACWRTFMPVTSRSSKSRRAIIIADA